MHAPPSAGSTSTGPGVHAVPAARRGRRRRTLSALALVALVVVLAAASIAIGSRTVGISDILAALGGASDGFDRGAITARLPRTALALLAGAALGIAGAVMQGVTRNPLADPGILGVTMGASLAVVIGIATFGLASARSFVWVAIAGAAIAAVFVYVVGSLGPGGPTPLKLALAGAATSAALVSFITAIVLPRNDVAGGVRSWQIGGVGGASFDRIGQVVPFLVIGFLLCLGSARALNSLALGDDVAAGLGERVGLVRVLAATGAVVLTGAITALTGPIGFVGLVVPHACRLLAGVDHRWLLPLSALAGGALLTLADVLGRIVARPAELDVAIVTAFIGAPVFIAIVRRTKVRAL